MRTFHRVEERRVRPGLPTEVEARLPVGQAAVVIGGFSALSWVVLISIVLVLRAVL
jgi:hypothetical protein